MSKNGATIYWVDPKVSVLQLCIIMEYELRNGSTYESEALCKKMPSDVKDYAIITFAEAGNSYAINTIERLRAISASS